MVQMEFPRDTKKRARLDLHMYNDSLGWVWSRLFG